MKTKPVQSILLVALCLLLTASSSPANDVPSLEATPTAVIKMQVIDTEAKVMAFTDCMREQGLDMADPWWM